jgi:hypothetical protein
MNSAVMVLAAVLVAGTVAGVLTFHRRHLDRGSAEPSIATGNGLRRLRMLNSWSVRVIIGAAVFVLGILAGAGVAAWLVPPA